MSPSYSLSVPTGTRYTPLHWAFGLAIELKPPMWTEPVEPTALAVCTTAAGPTNVVIQRSKSVFHFTAGLRGEKNLLLVLKVCAADDY